MTAAGRDRETMRAWAVGTPGPIASQPLRLSERPVPAPGPGEVLIEVTTCGVCRTDLHLAEGDLLPRQPDTTPGHEVVGTVAAIGSPAGSPSGRAVDRGRRLEVGQRVGVPWLASTCGVCRFCRSGRENLCLEPRFTGWDTDGGFAEYVVAREEYVYVLPDRFDDTTAAPLLCAGIIGYRALRRAQLPPGGRLGIYGFGASAHLTAQVAIAQGARVHVLTRSAEARHLAESLGAASAGHATDPPPEPLDAAILFAPVGTLVPVALAALDRGGTLSVAGIYLTDIPSLHYETHLFEERSVCSVTANTRRDGEEFLAVADRIGLRPTTTLYPFDAADQALADLAADRVNGAAVVQVGPSARPSGTRPA